MDGGNRQVRAFIQPSFRDMHVERDHLGGLVFPELRRMCNSRGVVWSEMDLRCGV